MSSILDLERKKAKSKAQRQHKLSRQQDRQDRLSATTPSQVRHRIDILLQRKQQSHNGKLSTRDEKILNELQSDYAYLVKKGNMTEDEDNQSKSTVDKPETGEAKQVEPEKLYRKSIFFDPEWNPTGIAPSSLIELNVNFDSKIHNHKNEELKVLDVPLPEVPQPKYYKLKGVSAVIQGEAHLNDAVVEDSSGVEKEKKSAAIGFIPRGVATKKRKINEV